MQALHFQPVRTTWQRKVSILKLQVKREFPLAWMCLRILQTMENTYFNTNRNQALTAYELWKEKRSLKSSKSQMQEEGRTCSVSHGTRWGATGGVRRGQIPSHTREKAAVTEHPPKETGCLGKNWFLIAGGFQAEGVQTLVRDCPEKSEH